MLKILKLTFWIVFLYIVLTYLIHNISAWTKISYVKVYMADILVNLLTNQLPYTVLMTLRPLNFVINSTGYSPTNWGKDKPNLLP